MTYPMLHPDPVTDKYVPRVFGYKIHESSKGRLLGKPYEPIQPRREEARGRNSNGHAAAVSTGVGEVAKGEGKNGKNKPKAEDKDMRGSSDVSMATVAAADG